MSQPARFFIFFYKDNKPEVIFQKFTGDKAYRSDLLNLEENEKVLTIFFRLSNFAISIFYCLILILISFAILSAVVIVLKSVNSSPVFPE